MSVTAAEWKRPPDATGTGGRTSAPKGSSRGRKADGLAHRLKVKLDAAVSALAGHCAANASSTASPVLPEPQAQSKTPQQPPTMAECQVQLAEQQAGKAPMGWNEFRRNHRGQGFSMAELAARYRRLKAGDDAGCADA